MIKRLKFFEGIRPLFTPMNKSQVEGLSTILTVWDQKFDGIWPVEYLAYALATAYHETNQTMKPIGELGGPKYLSKYGIGKLAKMLGNKSIADGVTFKGRGYVQLTGRANYAKASTKLGVDLVSLPNLAMGEAAAAQIMFAGMFEGWFTGKRLRDYLAPTGFQPVNARRIINGVDCAKKIAGHYDVFIKALKA